MKIQEKINTPSSNLSPDRKNSLISEIKNDIEQHKELAKNIIFQNPRSTAAYYALFQKLNNIYLFSPYVKEDRPYCAAVATSYHTFMPEYERSKNLYALVMDAITKERKAIKNEEWEKVLEKNGKGYIDIVLKDSKDKVRKLSELEGKVVLIDFSTYEMKESIEYTFALRDLYNKYHSRGFEIYQVSLDQSKDRWQQAVENIPWICVRDENGYQTPYVLSYNVTSIPTNFLMNKKGEIIARDLDFKQLSQMIDNLL
jgi:peroxiredoxin